MSEEQKVVVITGAASGIGLALAKACLKENMHVVMVDKAKKNLLEQAKHLSGFAKRSVLTFVCDVSKPADVEVLANQVYKHFHQVDLLINNAGIIGQLAPIWDIPFEKIQQVIDVNLCSVVHSVRFFLPLMFQQGKHSHIVNMSSIYGLCSGSQLGAYAMSKHGIVALSESLFFDLKRLKKSIDISVVCPSFTNTQLIANSAPNASNTLYDSVNHLMTRSRPAEDLADYILREINKKTFYILPDKEVIEYCEQRTQAMMNQTNPHEHSLEKIMTSLTQRANIPPFG